MAADIKLVRKMALTWPGVTEGVCFGTPAFYLRKRLMLRLREDGETLVVKFPPQEREEAIEKQPDIFSVTDHYKNYPVVLVSLLAVGENMLSSIIENAWRMLASRKQITAFEGDRPNKEPNIVAWRRREKA